MDLDHSIVFERVVGPLGASIAPGDYPPPQEDGWDEGGSANRIGEVDLDQTSMT